MSKWGTRLRTKEKSLQDEIEKVRSDKSIDGETAKLKIEALKKEMEEIENKIQELKGNKGKKQIKKKITFQK